MNGRLYEAAKAWLESRESLDIYHTALQVLLPDHRYVVETTWPRPDRDMSARGVVREGAVFYKWLSFSRLFRYEVRCWTDGVLPDAAEAVGGPRLVSEDAETCRRLLGLTAELPPFTWGRKAPGCDDMWNSNSVISWLLARSAITMESLKPPEQGRAPGWRAGIEVASSTYGCVSDPR